MTALPECPLLSQFLRGIEAYGDELGSAVTSKVGLVLAMIMGSFLFW